MMPVRLQGFSFKFQITEEDGQGAPDTNAVDGALNGLKEAMDKLGSVGKLTAKSPDTSSSRASSISRSEFSLRDMVLLISVKCFLYFTDIHGQKYSEKVEFELTSDGSLALVMNQIVKNTKIKPRNGEFCGVLYTGSVKEKKLRPIFKKESESQPIRKLLSTTDSTTLQLHYDCMGKLRRSWNRCDLDDYQMWSFDV